MIRKKFSVSSFTSDCIRYKVTHFQYIGELCRYLVSFPSNDQDRLLSLQCAYGNGLRPELWLKFKDRYHIHQIVEFYGATEANIFTFNPVGKVGAIGYIPRLFDIIYPAFLIRPGVEDTSIPYRDSRYDNHCVSVGIDEAGLLICQIQDYGERSFDGYTDRKATESKILR